MDGPLIWLQGRVQPASAFTVAPTDEFLLYGRGVFQTTRTFDGHPWLWDRHTTALLEAAQAMGIPLEPSMLPTAEEAKEYVEHLATGDVILRLNVGARQPGESPIVWMFHRSLPAGPTEVCLATCPVPVSRNDQLAAIKSMNYLARHLAFEFAREHGCDDALLLSDLGEVLETAHGNLFAKIDGKWLTPPAGPGMLAGTVRGLLLDVAPAGAVRESALTVNDLFNAAAVITTNSVHGVRPVVAIDQKELKLEDAAVAELRALLTET